jgi:hypothetical protein
MATAVDFARFSDDAIDLSLSGNIDRTLSRNLSIPVSGEGALLTWNVRREGVGSVTYLVRVNGNESGPYSVTLADWSAVQEALDTSNIKAGNNTIEFQLTGGTATLSFGDVVLFYRKSV